MAFGETEHGPERELTRETIIHAAETGLLNTRLLHDRLGPAGEEKVEKNQFGETALRMDIEAEETVINALREANIPIRIISEEHGTVDIGMPEYLGILDGLDGSSVYLKERGVGRYGTMFGIFDKLDPSYQDYIVSGIMEHSTGRLFVATRGGGAFIVADGKRTPIHTSGRVDLEPDTNIYVDEFFEINRRTFSDRLPEHKKTYLGSSAVYYADVSCGAADLALECTRKGNLELAVAFGLETEAGGAMVDLQGESLGRQKYLTFGQDRNVPVITAASPELARNLLSRIRGS